MLKQLTARKSVAAINREIESGTEAEPGAWAADAHCSGTGLDDRQWHLRAHRHRRGRPHRTGDHPRLPGRRPRVRPRGALLCRARCDDPGRRQCLQLHLCDARRGRRLVRRLEPRARIRHVRRRRGRRLVRVRREPARGIRAPPAGGPGQCAARAGRRPPPRPHRRAGQPAGRADRGPALLGLLHRGEAVDPGQQRDGADQGRHHPAVHRGRHPVRVHRPVAPLPAGQHRARRGSSASAA